MSHVPPPSPGCAHHHPPPFTVAAQDPEAGCRHNRCCHRIQAQITSYASVCPLRAPRSEHLRALSGPASADHEGLAQLSGRWRRANPVGMSHSSGSKLATNSLSSHPSCPPSGPSSNRCRGEGGRSMGTGAEGPRGDPRDRSPLGPACKRGSSWGLRDKLGMYLRGSQTSVPQQTKL